MGVDVVLTQVSQPGTSSKRRRLTQVDVVPDGDDVFARICVRSQLPMLSRVDPYGDLVLTTSEMPQLLAEVNEEQVSPPRHRSVSCWPLSAAWLNVARPTRPLNFTSRATEHLPPSPGDSRGLAARRRGAVVRDVRT